jgi:uncharacterized protein YbaR (Trm112 family)
MRQNEALACPVCNQPLANNGHWDKEAMKKFIDLYSSRSERSSVNDGKLNDLKMKCKRWTRKSLQLLSEPLKKKKVIPNATEGGAKETNPKASHEVVIATASSRLIDCICII